MFTLKFIKIFHSVQKIGLFSLFQNLNLGKASINDKCHFAIVSLFSEFEPRQKLNQSQVSFDNLMGYILSISMCLQNFITIFHSVQEIAPLSLFQSQMTFDNPLGYILSISMRMQNFIKIFQTVKALSTFFTNRPGTKCSQTVQGQNLHKLSGDKIKCLIIGHSMKFNFKFQLTFLLSCNYVTT